MFFLQGQGLTPPTSSRKTSVIKSQYEKLLKNKSYKISSSLSSRLNHQIPLIFTGKLQQRIRQIIIQVATSCGYKIFNGVVSADHIHVLVSIPPHISVSEFVKKAKGRSSFKVQKEFPELRKRYWGRRFWGRGYFSTTTGNITDEIINEYINKHFDAHKSNYGLNEKNEV